MTTPLESLAEALLACRAYASGAESAPAAILWCDPAGDFAPVMPALRTRLPHLLTFGAYDAAMRTGPSLWLRAAAARAVPGLDWHALDPPVIYLPGHGREVLRGAEECPAELQPLVWFAVTGVFFGQPKQARDWTLRGFLAAQGSPVSLNVPDDRATREALARAAARLFTEPLALLKGRTLDAAALDGMLVPDPTLDMLRWMDGTLTPETDSASFDAFGALAAKKLGLDPRKKSRQDAAARLAKREKGWGEVWQRFEEGSGDYDGVVKLLAMEEPQDLLTSPEAYPTENIRRETALRKNLCDLAFKPYTEAVKAVLALEAEHGWRRETVWAKRGEAKLADALQHLALIATATALPANTPDAIAEAYVAEGWKIDAAAVAALDIARTGENRDAVTAALRTVYLPWLDAGAAALQALATEGKLPLALPKTPPKAPDNAALVFVDGLRMDVARRLSTALEARGAKVVFGWRWSGFPSVTATCKPLASPAAGVFAGGVVETLTPVAGGKPVTKPVLMKAIESAGWAVTETLLGSGPFWLEVGRFDEEGHSLGARLAERVGDGVTEITELVLRLARQKRRVRIVTDHGWLLMPGGLPFAELHAGMTASNARGNRVATLKEGAATNYTLLPWSWDQSVLLATAPGARAFYNGTEYAHGGISPQECVLPVIDVTAEGEATPLSISASWQRLRLRVEVKGGAGMMFDLRPASDAYGPSLLSKGARILDDAGQVNVLVSDEHVGKDVCVVVYAPGAPSDVRAKLNTRIEG
ncbi:BREX-1 system phosphatase PglZ type B [Bradyrhizobium sp. CSS354]|uniref:BREX-1 system phosphatase PglZ type B n=1 Tax=Bradyrhizobium sp. CSS354 TaxID=2699172 RepID=UPI0023B1DFEC|nr:BREX-1 system phosphatase PglZ type B [Bradyrhizobium sp. CSS354]MDE5461347.1 BREX-1 system phosphatase PglZ type B [Bradyrhizobium sp. CSS354]